MIKKILKENYIYIIVIVSLIAILTIIMKSPLHEKILVFDNIVINFVKSIHEEHFIALFKVLTYFGDFYIPCFILVCVLVFHNNRWIFLLQTCSYAFAGIITYIAKILVARPRPLEALINMPKTYSFPSGHTLTSFVFYMTLFYLLSYKKSSEFKTVEKIAIIASLLIACSRIYLGVHYFSDVIGGLIIAIPCVLMIRNIISKNFDKKLLS